uniref:Retrovirus-related Pol polyprotein from transposon TNT 1-94 n=1 Tax=Tanacetum cinerariifolium TaxID=118510 RepID=A0A6L2LMV5_TANCI|nr:retrovirus-related Pol polyprotein from transposon TNT 1-94 [Tanacetum cinerariifolium]
MKIKESLNVKFDETPTPSKTSPLVDDDLDEQKAIKVTKKKNLENDFEDETLEIDKIINIKESKNHPLENVIENLNQRTLSLEESKPMKIPMSSDIKLTKYKDGESVDNTKYRGMIGERLCGSKSTSGICMFLGYCLTSWFSKKQTALAIFTTKVEYISAGKACAIELSKDPVQHSHMTHIKIRHHILHDKDHILACLAHMLYCVATSTQYNIAFFVSKRIEFIRSFRGYILPYGMLLTRLFRHVMDEYPRLQSDQYGFVNRVMLPLSVPRQSKPRKDIGVKRARHSTSSSSVFDHGSSSRPVDDEEIRVDEGNSRVSTPSPTTYYNYLPQDVPQIFFSPPPHEQNMENLFTRQTSMMN